MPGLILPDLSLNKTVGVAGTVSGHNTSARQLFAQLFAGQTGAKMPVSAKKTADSVLLRQKTDSTDNADNVNSVLALLAPPIISGLAVPPGSRQSAAPLAAEISTLLQQKSATRQPAAPRIMKAEDLNPLKSADGDGEARPIPQPDNAALRSAVIPEHTTPGQMTAHPAAITHHPLPIADNMPVPADHQTIPQPIVVTAGAALVTTGKMLRPVATTEKTPGSLAPVPQATGIDLLSQADNTISRAGVINVTPGSPDWQQQLNQQVIFMHQKGVHSAELRLHPQDLGSLKISLVMKSDQTDMTFISGHSQVRMALEAALPHLKHALAESGISLGESHVGSDDPSSAGMPNQSDNFTPSSRNSAADSSPGAAGGSGHTTATLSPAPPTRGLTPAGRVDLFA